MAWLEIDSLFTNIPLDETINISIDLLFKEGNVVSGFSKNYIFEML